MHFVSISPGRRSTPEEVGHFFRASGRIMGLIRPGQAGQGGIDPGAGRGEPGEVNPIDVWLYSIPALILVGGLHCACGAEPADDRQPLAACPSDYVSSCVEAFDRDLDGCASQQCSGEFSACTTQRARCSVRAVDAFDLCTDHGMCDRLEAASCLRECWTERGARCAADNYDPVICQSVDACRGTACRGL